MPNAIINMFKNRIAEMNTSIGNIEEQLKLAILAENDVPAKDSHITSAQMNTTTLRAVCNALQDFLPIIEGLAHYGRPIEK